MTTTARGTDVRPYELTPQPVSTDDLWSAIEWLSTYEGDEDDQNVQALANVMSLLRKQAIRREATSTARKVLKQKGYQKPSAGAVKIVADAIVEQMEQQN